MRVFVSYSWRQGEWVWNSLVPCLKAAGCEVLIDVERMVVGKEVFAQMDEIQAGAECTVLVLSPDYLSSKACMHEMQRAISAGTSLPCYRENVAGFPPE